jgi:hypothetical protein
MLIIVFAYVFILGVLVALSVYMLGEDTYINYDKYRDGLVGSYDIRSFFNKLMRDPKFNSGHDLLDVLSRIEKKRDVREQLSKWRDLEERREDRISGIMLWAGLCFIMCLAALSFSDSPWWANIVCFPIGAAAAIITSFLCGRGENVYYKDETWNGHIDFTKMTARDAMHALEEYCTWVEKRRYEFDRIINRSCRKTRRAFFTTTCIMLAFPILGIIVFFVARGVLL